MLLGIFLDSGIVPGKNWVGIFGTTVILVECIICFAYTFKFAPAVSVASSDAVAAKLAVMLVFGIVLVIAGDVLQTRKLKRNRERIKRILSNTKKGKNRFTK